MSETSDTYCSLCDIDLLTSPAFWNHVADAAHCAEELRGRADSLELLLRIHDLLKQLVDKGQQVTPSDMQPQRYLCQACGLISSELSDMGRHEDVTGHCDVLVLFGATR